MRIEEKAKEDASKAGKLREAFEMCKVSRPAFVK
jgi:hypothetical protein